MSLKNLNAKIKVPKILNVYLRNKKINQIYLKFEKSLKINENFIVAVSGGPDSLALAFLSKIYSIKKGVDVKYLIIDHKLRPESTSEAKKVQQILKKKLIKSQILSWKGKKPSSNIQSIARKKRYELLCASSKNLKSNNILLGHHEDDLIENFFIRLIRGSGLKGLVSLSGKKSNGNINLLRPLINEKKDTLTYISKKVFNFYVKDPSNENEKFLRVGVRKLLNELTKFGLDKDKMIKTINNLKTSNDVVNFYVSENLKKNTFFSTKKNQLIINKAFFEQPYEVIFRSISDSLKFVGKKYYPPRGKKLDVIVEKIRKKQLINETLAGCIVKKVNGTVIISKER